MNRKNTLRQEYAGLLVALALLIPGIDTTVLGGVITVGGEGERNVEEMKIPEVLKERTGALMSIQGVVGTGQGLCDGRPCIKVYVVKKTPEVEQKIRSILEPYPFSIQESGRFRSR
jgi:hypothetical protein